LPPPGGEHTGPNPSDKGKKGSKRHIVVDHNGVPLAVVYTAANVHDSKVLEEAEPSFRGRVALYAVVVVIEAGEAGRPRGATYRVAYEGVLEGGTFVPQQRADLGHLPDGGVVQVVGEDEKDVGAPGGRNLRPLRRLGGFGLGRGSLLRGSGTRAAGGEKQKERQARQEKPEGSPSPCASRPIAAAHGHQIPTLYLADGSSLLGYASRCTLKEAER
jgi:hypothetical protein